jgi:hypothetical protein
MKPTTLADAPVDFVLVTALEAERTDWFARLLTRQSDRGDSPIQTIQELCHSI